MRPAAIALLVLVLVAAIPFVASHDAFAEPVDVTVTGRVVTGFDHTGLADADVYVDGVRYCTTEQNGSFSFLMSKELSARCDLRFEKKGFLVKAFFYNGELLGRDNMYMIVTGENVILPDVIMDEALGTIEGKVTLGTKAVPNMTVEVRDLDSGERTMKTTGDEGMYSFSLPVGGRYHVSINNLYYSADGTDVDLTDIEPFVWNFVLKQKNSATYLFG
ncbi:MAG: carboxypeptidase-like regulatory domain-containing protein, partial [Methanomassiliicoccaceae archaeon]|nr:carboxypeptidase-like regulatory domain-containing protein [Methanomassiliicoccaceae archaeon]